MLSIAVALSLRPLELLTWPAHPFSLNAVWVALSAAYALIAMLGTPHTGGRLLSASAGGILAASGSFLAEVSDYVGGFTSVSNEYIGRVSPQVWFYLTNAPMVAVICALALAAILALARIWTPAFVVLLSTVPFLTALDVATTSWLWYSTGEHRATTPWLVSLAVATAIAALVLVSKGVLRLPARRKSRDATPTP